VARLRRMDGEAVERWHQEGYLVLEGALDVEQDLAPVVREYEVLLDELCRRWQAEGRLADAYAALPFGRRLSRALAETGERYERYVDFALPQANITEETPIHLGPAVFRMLTSPRLLDAVEWLIGPEIACNPIHHTRIKVPQREVPEERWNSHTAATDWHQDLGVALPEQDGSHVLTVWLPVTEATVQTGAWTCATTRSARPAGARPSPASSPAAGPIRSRSSTIPNAGPPCGWRRAGAWPGCRRRSGPPSIAGAGSRSSALEAPLDRPLPL
jgi:Phytanoyl-CoA dioxygenase (PhyH)